MDQVIEEAPEIDKPFLTQAQYVERLHNELYILLVRYTTSDLWSAYAIERDRVLADQKYRYLLEQLDIRQVAYCVAEVPFIPQKEEKK